MNLIPFFQQLEANANFRMLVADHIQKQFFDNGPFTVQNATARFTGLENQIYGPTVPESARWGDVLRPSQPYTRNVEWQAEINRILNQYIPQRTAIQDATIIPAITNRMLTNPS